MRYEAGDDLSFTTKSLMQRDDTKVEEKRCFMILL